MNPLLVDAIGGSSLFLVSLSMLPGSLISTPHLRGEGWLILIIVLTRGFSLAHWFPLYSNTNISQVIPMWRDEIGWMS